MAKMIIKLLILVLSTVFSSAWYYSHQDVGEVKIAGIFNVHLKGNLGKRCGIIDPQYGIMFVEAMLFALDRINNDTSILHGLKLRTRIYDTCGDKLYLRNILVQVANYHSQGVVGPQYSDDAITTATIMNIFGKNTISYAATSPDLENRIRHGYFYRTVPSDYNAVKLLVSLALKFKWNYIALISSEGNYGQRSSDLFRDSATKQGICIPIDMTISEDAKTGDYEYILQMIKKQSAIKVVYLLLTDNHLKIFFEVAQKLKEDIGYLQFVASDGWGTRSFVASGKTVANGTITFQVDHSEVREFREYFLKLKPATNKRNVWFEQFWEETFNCTFKNSTVQKACTGDEELTDGVGYYSQTPVLSVINAMYAYAYAFKKVIWYECLITNKTVDYCSKNKTMLQKLTSYRAILSHVRETQFKEPFRNKIFKFSASGDYDEDYKIYNFQMPNNTTQGIFKEVGRWNNVDNKTVVFRNTVQNFPLQPETWRLNIDADRIGWKSNALPVSVCSRPCDPGHVQHFRSACCWTCVACKRNDVIRNNTCLSCHLTAAPDPSRRYCNALPVKTIAMYKHISVTILSVSILGIFATSAVGALFLKNFDRRIVRASSRELCLLMLLGIICAYASPIAFIIKPSSMVCNSQRVIVGIGLTSCYAPLLLRTNRIYRIFKSAKTTASCPSMISPRSQIAMSMGTSGIGLLIGLVSILGRDSQINTAYPSHREFVVQYCELNAQTMIVNLSFSSALMIATTWFAFKTRNFPKNYNEAKYIGLTMYVTCLVLAVVLPLFLFINDEEGKSRTLTLCSLCLITASVNLLGLFGNKVKLLVSKNAVEIDTNIATLETTRTNMQRIGVTVSFNDKTEFKGETSCDRTTITPTA
ncbi:metabotropic glutamate receptor 3-like [Rhopilema esculentum]|uniref:metabotropic glutamate receptor 3-like n=1 Tax=Rhopilema esculentum TaxID=499914 RepID=UPI0031D3D734